MSLIQRLQIIGAVTLVGSVTLAASAPQQRSPAQTPPVYDVAAEVTLSGTITDVKTISGADAQGGVHIVLKTSTEMMEIDLGPEWYLTQQKYTLARGDVVTVTGSRVKVGTAAHVVAREVKKGAETMTFRDAKGFPKWSGRGRL